MVLRLRQHNIGCRRFLDTLDSRAYIKTASDYIDNAYESVIAHAQWQFLEQF